MLADRNWLASPLELNLMRILFLQKRLLFPTDTGGKIRTLNVVRHLAKWHEVTYLCNVQPHERQFESSMRDLGIRLETVPWQETPRSSWKFYLQLASNLASQYPFNVNKDFDVTLRERARQLLAESSFDLVICDFVQMARNAIGLPVPASILFQHNVEAEIFKRHAETDSGWFRRAYMGTQWRKMRRFEAAAGRQFDRVIAVSDRDREIYQQDYGWSHVSVIDTAVDTEYFQPHPEAEVAERIVFVGSLDWLPNEGGVEHFVRHIWPEIKRRRPHATFQVVGRNPGAAITRLSSVDGVEVIGTVPDVRPYIAEAAVVVVPLLVGGGTRLKIFEAMSMQKAVVSTTLGAEGLPVENGQHLVLSDNPESFAESVARLLEDAQRRQQISAEAYRFVHKNFSSSIVARQFDQICREAVDVKTDTKALVGT